jgi:hypothetical protein
MSTSSSSASAVPAISVVIGSSAPSASLEACLTGLERQLDDRVEVLVHEAVVSSPALRERFGWARFIHSPGALVPELWRDGIDRARGRIVALTIAQMVPAPDWIEQIRVLLDRHDAVGGAIDPGSRLRPTDWGEYFCRYARDMRPFDGRESIDLPGDNAAYKRALLEDVRDSYRNGFWEPEVHKRLEARGSTLWHAPELLVRQGRSAGWRAFARQRLRHGREYGHQRGTGFGKGRLAVGVLASPMIPLVMTARVLREVSSRRRLRGRAVAVLPIVFSFNLVWAVAEALGYVDILRRR